MTHAPARLQLDRLWRRGRDFLGTEVAILGGAMTWVSERNLVAAISNAGGFGVIATGSMNPEQLRETTMDPGSRTLQQVEIDVAAELNTEQIFSDLMGDKVEPREDFIERHARDVRFLDV